MFVEQLSGLQAVVDLAEEFVEQVADGGAVAVAVFSPAPVVLTGRGAVGGRGEGPDPAGGGESVVFDVAVGDADGASGGPDDGRGSGVGLQCAHVGESGAVVADLGEHPGAGRVGEDGKLVMIA